MIVNQTAFRGRLPEPSFEIRKLRASWGKLRRELTRHVIVVDRRFFEQHPEYTLAELVATLGHESIHILQDQLGRPMRHDRFFKEEAARLGVE